MRRLILLGLIAAMAVRAGAAKRVTVAQLEQTLAAAIFEHRADTDVARQVGGLELTERLTEVTIGRFAARLPLQPKTALAMQLLADQAAFLDPPTSEIPATGRPDAAAQQAMLEAARNYSVQVWTRLPNFFVTRSTTRFDDTPQVQRAGDWPVRAGLHPVGTTSRQIAFRDGKEVEDIGAQISAAAKKDSEEIGLRSWGEFGPALMVVLADMAKHTVTFSHWEQTAMGLAAVYRYQVPREASHYAVSMSYTGEPGVGRTQFGYGGQRRSPQEMADTPQSREARVYRETPAYHGTLAIDPVTGAVQRITIETELSKGNPLLKAASVVEYGGVVIGDRRFICPLRSLAISMEESWMAGTSGPKSARLNGLGDDTAWQNATTRSNSPVLLINETRFVDYHRLGSTMRVITDATPNDAMDGGQTAAQENSDIALPPFSAKDAKKDGAPSQYSDDGSISSVAAASPHATAIEATATVSPTAAAAAPAAPANPEISMSAAAGVPDLPAAAAAQDSGFSLKVTTRLVDVGLVAYDKKGRPVTDLKAEDIEIYDNGHKQEIRFFSQPRTELQSANAMPAAAEAQGRSFSNRATDAASLVTAPVASTGNATILLIDEGHIAWSDMNNARNQMLKFLETLSPSESVGLYNMTGRGMHVLVEITNDHAALITSLKTFIPTAQSVSQAEDEETRNRQHIDEVRNVADLNSVNGNHLDVPDGEQSVDPQLRTMGSNPARDSLIVLASVARHLAAIPGHKSVVWVSTDNVFADWQDQAVSNDRGPSGVDSYALRAQEAMNDAHAAVYPFDVSQIESAAVTADLRHGNVELTPSAAENAASATSASRTASAADTPKTAGGRSTAEMSQDLHPIRESIRGVAAATGGKTIRRSSDLVAALNEIVDDGQATYQVSFSPQGAADDQYHAIAIKLSGRRGVSLRYRTGYLFAKEPTTLKQRFQQAIWRPMDVSEIAVTANVSPMSESAPVKLNIAAADLAMAQQGGRWMDKVDIFFIERDDTGLHAHVEGQTLGLRLKPSTYQAVMTAGVPFERAVSMQPGMASLRVLVVDENSGRMGSVTIPALAIGTVH